MFEDLAAKLRRAVGDYLEQRSWPVPEVAVNLALKAFIREIPELESLEVTVREGSFVVHATGRKGVAFAYEGQFAVEFCDISAERQHIALRRLGKPELTSQTLQERIVLTVVQAIFAVVLRSDPAAYLLSKQPGVRVKGDLYEIDLAQTAIADYVRDQTKMQAIASAFCIQTIRCEPGKFLVQGALRNIEAPGAPLLTAG